MRVSSGEPDLLSGSLLSDPFQAGQTSVFPLFIKKSNPNSPGFTSSISGGVV